MKAVILLTMGSPRSLKEVRPFLFRLFSDRSIINLPIVLRVPVALLISWFRTPKARKIYRQLGGLSPLMEETGKQAKRLEERLRKEGDYRCFIGTSYSAPSITDAIAEAFQQRATDYIFLPLYPQFSFTTTGSVLKEAERAVRERQSEASIRKVNSFEENEGFIQALTGRIERTAKTLKDKPKVLLTAHGLPESAVRQGDPYVQQCERTAQAISRKQRETVLCYQSRVGPLKWVGPQTKQEIEKAGREGKAIIVAPLSFVAECSETAYEIDILFRKIASQAGCPLFIYTGTVGTDAAFIDGLAKIILKD